MLLLHPYLASNSPYFGTRTGAFAKQTHPISFPFFDRPRPDSFCKAAYQKGQDTVFGFIEVSK